jgi:hypothetical protein
MADIPGLRYLAEFLARHATLSLPAVLVTRFWLYSSTLVGDVPTYRQEHCFPLLDNNSGGPG